MKIQRCWKFYSLTGWTDLEFHNSSHYSKQPFPSAKLGVKYSTLPITSWCCRSSGGIGFGGVGEPRHSDSHLHFSFPNDWVSQGFLSIIIKNNTAFKVRTATEGWRILEQDGTMESEGAQFAAGVSDSFYFHPLFHGPLESGIFLNSSHGHAFLRVSMIWYLVSWVF